LPAHLLLGLLQGVILPFAVVISGLILSGTLIWKYIETQKMNLFPLLSFAIGGAPMLIYQFVVVKRYLLS